MFNTRFHDSYDKQAPEEERRACSGATCRRLEITRTGSECYKALHYQQLINLIWLGSFGGNESGLIGFSVR